MRVLVCIPAFNEQATIRGVVESVRALGYEVLVVDDGSTDNTIVEAHAGGALIGDMQKNLGVGAALSYGAKVVEYCMHADVIVTFDADGQMDANDIPKLVAALDCHTDIVNGSRFLGTHVGMPWHRRLVLWFVYMAFWLTSGRELTDVCCGMKAFRPSAFRIKSKRFAWAAELCWNHRKERIREIPITVRYTPYSLKKGQRSSNIFRAGLELFKAIKETHDVPRSS